MAEVDRGETREKIASGGSDKRIWWLYLRICVQSEDQGGRW